jgi:hypothetical protein
VRQAGSLQQEDGSLEGSLNSKQVITIPFQDTVTTREIDQHIALTAVAGSIEGPAVGDFLNMKTKSEINCEAREGFVIPKTVDAFTLSDDEELGFA